MAKQSTQILIHPQDGLRGLKTVSGVLRDVKAVKQNMDCITHQATIIIDRRERTVYLDIFGKWHCYPDNDFGSIEPM
ncbi:MAG: hypothetical protein OXT74_08615 [Candidatus Poribacteria bacterium]|nr:hypothetical protein [Candidatus Poribacteria bacterium]